MAYVFVDPNPNTGATDGNVITDALINQASAKHWDLYHYNWSNSSWVPYTGSSTMRGDVNNDQNVDINDVTALINYVLTGNATGVNMTNANCDLQGNVDISDVTTLISYLLSGNWPASKAPAPKALAPNTQPQLAAPSAMLHPELDALELVRPVTRASSQGRE